MTLWCLFPNFICYGLASLFYLAIPFCPHFQCSEKKKTDLEGLANLFTFFGVFLQTVYIGYNFFYIRGYPYIQGPKEMMALLSCGLVFLFLWFAWRSRWVSLGSFFIPLAFILFILSLSHSDTPYPWLGGSVKPSWLVFIHILFALLSLLLLLGAFILGMAFLVHEHRLKIKKWDSLTMSLPPLLLNEKQALILLRLGFSMLTLVLITGALLLGQLISFFPWQSFHLILALLAWMIYALILNRRWLGVEGRKIVLLSFLGFVSLAALFLWN